MWTAASVSYLGDGVYYGAVPVLAASLTRDSRLISLVDALEMLGWLLLGLISGVLVDRWRRMTVMWHVDAVRAVIVGVFAGLVLSGDETMALILVASFLLGLAAPFFDNASSSVLPELVPESGLERANSLTQTSMLLGANLIGPPLGAALVVAAPGVPLAMQAVSFALAAVVVARVRGVGRAAPVAEHRPLHVELAEGLRYLWRHRLLRSLCLLLGAVNGVSGGVIAVLVLYVLEVMSLPRAAYGWLIAVFAVGGLLGAVLASRAREWFSLPTLVVGASAVFGVGIVVLGLFPQEPVVGVSLLVTGALSVVWNVITVSVRQRIVPAEILGRVTSVYRMVGFAAMPVGAVGAGLLANVVGLRATYVVAGAVLLVASVVAAPAISRGARALAVQVAQPA